MLRQTLGVSLLVACAAAPARPPERVVPPPVTPESALRDFDGDGLADPHDRCPREAATRLDGCPDPDADADRVAVPHDRCPDRRGVAPDGCPPPDADNDEVPDVRDACPESGETCNGVEDLDGCPDRVPPELARWIRAKVPGVEFELDQDVPRPAAFRTLARAAAVFVRYPDVHIEIVDHTESTGSVAYNVELSRRRAVAVKRLLVAGGVDAERLVARGAGPNEPIDYNDRRRRPNNRRTAFHLIERC